MKIALIHEFLTQYGGAERVLDAFLAIWPDAPVYTLVYDRQKMGKQYENFDIRTSFLQKLPGMPKNYKWYLPLMPQATESFDLSGYDVVLSDSSAYAKGVITKKPTVHISYIHTPTRYLWSDQKSYVKDAPVPGFARPFLPPVISYLKRWDFKAAQRPDYLIANSKNIAGRIQRYYNREADLILFPPVDTHKFTIAETLGDYWFVVGRQEPYKRTDLPILAAKKLGIKMIVAGTGTRREELARLAGPSVTFVGRVSDKELTDLYSHAIGFIFPANEDAGITPLESMAAGRPVLAYGQGGVLESVIPGKTGEFFDVQSVESLCDALSNFRPEQYDPKEIRAHAQLFDIENFAQTIKAFVADKVEKAKE